jgi:hypothetical protein
MNFDSVKPFFKSYKKLIFIVAIPGVAAILPLIAQHKVRANQILFIG